MAPELAKNPTLMTVVALALHDDEGRWLMHRRPLDKQHGGLWEFPGGKLEAGEDPRRGLAREVNEELGLELDPAVLQPAAFADAPAAEQSPAIVILLYTAPPPATAPQALEGGELGWFTAEEVLALPMPPLDVPLAEWLLCGRSGGIANAGGPAYVAPFQARP